MNSINGPRSMLHLDAPMTRRVLFKRSLAVGAGAVALTTLGSVSGVGGVSLDRFGMSGLGVSGVKAAPLDSDLEILNYALTLEHLEAAAYKAINDAGVLSGRAATYFKAFGAQESAHVDALVQTIQKLGGQPVAAAQYDFSSVPKDAAGVVKFFQGVEAVGASAYLGAAPSIKNPDILAAALSIHAVEAEHASALADLVAPGTDLFAPDAFAKPRTPDEVMAIVTPFFGTMPGMPNTGEGGTAPGATGLSRTDEAAGALGILGLAAAAALAYARRHRGDSADEPAQS